jgi:hypothetical protein
MIKNIDFLFMIDKANKELKKVHEFLTSLNDTLLQPTNLKLYDVFFSCDDTEQFYSFCENSFEEFEEYIKDQTNTNFNKLVHYIGRTSKFYCLSNELYNNIITERDNIILPDTIFNLFNNIFCYDNLLNFDKNGYIDTIQLLEDVTKYDLDKSDTVNYLKYIINGDFLTELKALFSDCFIVYDYIKDFKENQEEYFNDFVTANEL